MENNINRMQDGTELELLPNVMILPRSNNHNILISKEEDATDYQGDLLKNLIDVSDKDCNVASLSLMDETKDSESGARLDSQHHQKQHQQQSREEQWQQQIMPLQLPERNNYHGKERDNNHSHRHHNHCHCHCRLDRHHDNEPRSKLIGIIGTGNMAISLTKRLVTNGYTIIIGSRNPDRRQEILSRVGNCKCSVTLTTNAECLRRCEVIFLAMHMEDFKITLAPFSLLTRGKILVDLSNRNSRYARNSNAQYLSTILPEAEIVKAFNSIPASVLELPKGLESASHENRNVYVSANDRNARNVVMEISRTMGFHAVDFGGLKNALYLEDFVLKTFPGWKIPIFLTFGIFNLWSLYCVYVYFINKNAYQWEQIFLKFLNKPLCMTAITVLALTFLPGQIASVIQVYRGTKHSFFPRILDTWLKSRKQLGLIAYILVVFHVLASIAMLSPTYYHSWFHQPSITIPKQFPAINNSLKNMTSSADTEMMSISLNSSWMVWKAELTILFGFLAFLALSIQAVTSIPSVAASLNWSEWTCVQSKLGTWVLILAAGHVISMSAPSWVKREPVRILKSITFLSLILPMCVLIMKFVFGCTPLSRHLHKIRNGWEREKQFKILRCFRGSIDSQKSRYFKAGDKSGSLSRRSESVPLVLTDGSGTDNDNEYDVGGSGGIKIKASYDIVSEGNGIGEHGCSSGSRRGDCSSSRSRAGGDRRIGYDDAGGCLIGNVSGAGCDGGNEDKSNSRKSECCCSNGWTGIDGDGVCVCYNRIDDNDDNCNDDGKFGCSSGGNSNRIIDVGGCRCNNETFLSGEHNDAVFDGCGDGDGGGRVVGGGAGGCKCHYSSHRHNVDCGTGSACFKDRRIKSV